MSIVIKSLVESSGLHEMTVRRIILSAPNRYKHFKIKKRSGGTREIAQPAKELKILQRAFMSKFLENLPVHDAAMAYRKGLSIRDNAQKHAGTGPVLKMDFKDFFPSITEVDWVFYCKEKGIFTEGEDLRLSTLLLFHRPKGARKLRLAIGAPSSPLLSNIIMFDFDQKLSELVSKDSVSYTRYADDLTFSAERTGFLTGVKRSVSKVINTISSPILKINHAKTVYITRKYHRTVTGLTLANDGRVTIGRSRKREIRAKVHYFMNGKLDLIEAKKLAGLISFVSSVEPMFVDTLHKTYGSATMKFLAEINFREPSLKL